MFIFIPLTFINRETYLSKITVDFQSSFSICLIFRWHRIAVPHSWSESSIMQMERRIIWWWQIQLPLQTNKQVSCLFSLTKIKGKQFVWFINCSPSCVSEVHGAFGSCVPETTILSTSVSWMGRSPVSISFTSVLDFNHSVEFFMQRLSVWTAAVSVKEMAERHVSYHILSKFSQSPIFNIFKTHNLYWAKHWIF